jgi:glucose-6-phosphate-specific signal transduction histidine kinase
MPPLNFSDQQKQSWCELASLVLAGLALWMVLKAGLVLALFSGLLIFSLIHRMEPLIAARFRHRQPRMLALIVLALILSTAIFAGSWAFMHFCAAMAEFAYPAAKNGRHHRSFALTSAGLAGE